MDKRLFLSFFPLSVEGRDEDECRRIEEDAVVVVSAVVDDVDAEVAVVKNAVESRIVAAKEMLNLWTHDSMLMVFRQRRGRGERQGRPPLSTQM